MAETFAPFAEDPILPTWFEFAITTNHRGRKVAELMSGVTSLQHKSHLDVGCAYGGFLVGFAEQGCNVVGVDIDENLLDLARRNLEDQGVEACLLTADATAPKITDQLGGSFDLVTCNDVIEHVPDASALLVNTAALLSADGIAYFEIPNGEAVEYVISDGHFGLFGITLLDYEEASQYCRACRPGMEYGTYNYLSLEEYLNLFAKAGLKAEALTTKTSVATTLRSLDRLRDCHDRMLEAVPHKFQSRVSQRVSAYLDEVAEVSPASREFAVRFGADMWQLIARPME